MDSDSESSWASLDGDDEFDSDISRKFDYLCERLRESGMFSSSRTYADAPNPGLEIKDLGLIGLPLSSRDAAALQGHGTSFEDRRVPNGPFRPPIPVVGGPCINRRVDERQITFHHTGWAKFVEKASQDARMALGIQAEIRCHLARFIVQARPKNVRYRVDTPSLARGTDRHLVGTMAVIPCSHYAGGDVTVSHDAGTTRYTPGAHDTFATTCIVWRSDAALKLGSLAHGSRIIFIFAITSAVHPSEGALLPVDKENLSRLGRCFSNLSYSLEHLGDPEKIVHILKDKHPRVNLCTDALRGEDARVVAIIAEHASLHGLHLGLASVAGSVTETGYEVLERKASRYGRRHYYVQDYYNDYAWVYMENLVSPTGQLLIGDISSEDPHWGQKMSLSGALRDEVLEGMSGHDEEELEHNGDAVKIKRIYYRTALVVWKPGGAFQRGLASRADGKPLSESRSTALRVVRQAIVDQDQKSDELELVDWPPSPSPSEPATDGVVGSTAKFGAPAAGETSMLVVTVKRQHSISPLPSTLDVVDVEGQGRRPVKRERSRSVAIKSEEMVVDWP